MADQHRCAFRRGLKWCQRCLGDRAAGAAQILSLQPPRMREVDGEFARRWSAREYLYSRSKLPAT